MTYLVMETHSAYAVLLDEEGRYLKAANLQYQVGDVVQNIIALKYPSDRVLKPFAFLGSAAAAAACFLLFFFGYYQPNYMPYGTLRMRINPDVCITLSETEHVLGVEGLNADGHRLIDNYDYHGKVLNTAACELAGKAMELGYLTDGGVISILADSEDGEWSRREEEKARRSLQEYIGDTVTITIGIPSGEEVPSRPATYEDAIQITIPVEPPSAPRQPSSPAASESSDGEMEPHSSVYSQPAIDESLEHDDDGPDDDGGGPDDDDDDDDSPDDDNGPDDDNDGPDDDDGGPDDDGGGPDDDDDGPDDD